MPLAPDWEDLTEFFDADEFAVEALIARQSGGTLTVLGIFDAPYLNAQIGEYEIDTDQPRLLCRATALPGVLRGDTVTIDGTAYDVMTGPQPDGTGLATLALARRPA
ncbi:head-tail joining protein [Roseovarius ramblicola]|uniref:Head-tail joining protein n=1 Tax=Roseovarius ramblicola TaxID=2022336 RepID=A0ABV5HYP1_9RHOB